MPELVNSKVSARMVFFLILIVNQKMIPSQLLIVSRAIKIDRKVRQANGARGELTIEFSKAIDEVLYLARFACFVCFSY